MFVRKVVGDREGRWRGGIGGPSALFWPVTGTTQTTLWVD